MILGERCNVMLPNQSQCANTAVEGSDMCKLHIALQERSAVEELPSVAEAVAEQQETNTVTPPEPKE